MHHFGGISLNTCVPIHGSGDSAKRLCKTGKIPDFGNHVRGYEQLYFISSYTWISEETKEVRKGWLLTGRFACANCIAPPTRRRRGDERTNLFWSAWCDSVKILPVALFAVVDYSEFTLGFERQSIRMG